jgi:hypothetical protein
MDNLSYKWKLSDLKKVKKNNLKVMSLFSGAGGSSAVTAVINNIINSFTLSPFLFLLVKLYTNKWIKSRYPLQF